MRAFVLVLALLAGLKIWASEQLFRSAAEEAVVNAYRERAVAACQREAGREVAGRDAARELRSGSLMAAAWAKPAQIRLVIGKRNLEVNIWDRDNALWNTRYKSPYLLLSPPEGTGLGVCEYDVTLGQAAISRT